MRDIVIRHSREGGNPVRRAAFWIPAFAGMTGFYECIAQKVKNYSWQKDYADSSALFIPTISFSVVVERQQKIGGRLMWLTSTTSDTLLTPNFPAGN